MRITLLCLPALCMASMALAADADRPGCKDSAVLTRMQGCTIARCDYKDYNEALMPLKAGDRQHVVEGEFEKIHYRCPAGTSPLQIIRNVEGALKAAGFAVLYSDKYFTTRYWATGKKGVQWVYAYSDGVAYELTTVKVKEMEQVMQANAEGWGAQIAETGRASIYGINFDTGKATIRPDSEPALKEVVKLLQANPSWAMMIAGHTDNVGAKDMNIALSRQRAESVLTWLAANGVEKSRLAPAGFGDTRPLAENTNEDGRAKNRRVDLVKVY